MPSNHTSQAEKVIYQTQRQISQLKDAIFLVFEQRNRKAHVTVKMRPHMGHFGSVTFTVAALFWVCPATFSHITTMA